MYGHFECRHRWSSTGGCQSISAVCTRKTRARYTGIFYWYFFIRRSHNNNNNIKHNDPACIQTARSCCGTCCSRYCLNRLGHTYIYIYRTILFRRGERNAYILYIQYDWKWSTRSDVAVSPNGLVNVVRLNRYSRVKYMLL